MIIRININRENLKYLDSICGIQGRSGYINNLLSDARKEPEDSDDEDEQILRLHRRQQGYTFPTMIKPRGQSGSIRRGHSEYRV